MAIRKCNLNGMQDRAIGQALDGRYLSTIGLDRQHSARFDRITVHEDGATTALAGVTTHVRAG
jgi:hypothetical protein